MSFDALTLTAVRDELEPQLTDARLQKLVFPDELSLAMEVFSPQAGSARILLPWGLRPAGCEIWRRAEQEGVS